MKALLIDEPGKTRISEVPRPEPGQGEALVAVRLVGFCGSDLSTYRGKNPLVSYPRIPGHELAGTVEALGPDVPPSIKPGTLVTISPYTACGMCPSCRRGRVNACQFNQTLGVQRDGAMTEFLAVPWEKVHQAEGLTLRELCLVEPLSVGFHAAARGRVASGDTVLVFGCGAIGLGAVAACAFCGARTIAADIDDAKLALARKAGASEVINTRQVELHEALQRLTGGDGPDAVIEAVGLPETFVAAVEEVAFTGRVVYIGYAKAPVSYETKLFVQKELDVLGSRNALPEDFSGVIDMLRQGRFPVEDAITATIPLANAGKTLEEWNSNPGSFTKILVGLE